MIIQTNLIFKLNSVQLHLIRMHVAEWAQWWWLTQL